MRVRAYAKVNLGLEVLARRTDDYHELRTILQTIDLYDSISLNNVPSGIELTTTDSELSTGSDNLVYCAAKLLAESRRGSRGVSIHLEKHIPAARGLGGGSADAAVTLLALNELWDLNVPISELHGLATTLGMDVPFFLYGGTALAVGRGDEVYPLNHQLNWPVVILIPPFSMATKEVYQRLRLTRHKSSLTLTRFAWNDPLDESSLAALVNELESAVGKYASVIRQYKEALHKRGALVTLMSGSGSAVFGVFPDSLSAKRVAAVLEGEGISVIATSMLSRREYQNGIREL